MTITCLLIRALHHTMRGIDAALRIPGEVWFGTAVMLAMEGIGYTLARDCGWHWALALLALPGVCAAIISFVILCDWMPRVYHSLRRWTAARYAECQTSQAGPRTSSGGPTGGRP